MRNAMKGACALAAAGLLAACTEQALQLGFQPDIEAPTVTIVVPASDTIDVQNGFTFTVDATDNLGLKTIDVTFTAGLTGQTITFTSAVTNFSGAVTVPQSETATLGGPVLITATAVDGNNNAATDTVTIYAVNPKALIVTLVRPTAGAISAPGKQLVVEVHAQQVDGLQLVGWRTVPGAASVSATDTLYTPGLPADTSILDTLTIPATTAAGTFSIIGFAKDASDRIVSTPPVVVTVQLVVTDTTGPIVTFTVAQRAEVRDSISVRARDPSGISSIGWLAFDTSGAAIGGATTALGGTLTDVIQRYNLNLSLTGGQLPAKLIIKAFATDANGNTDSARVDTLTLTSAVRADTITVINGITVALPAGGRVADAVYNPNRDELYLTNIDLDRVEVFSVADTSFKTAITVGSRPWGIALWPRDTLGDNADTVIVGNSGSTDMSIVNVALGQEVRRHPLPSFGVETVHTVVNAGGGIDLQVTEYLFDDRPQYLATVCRKGNCTDSVLVVYSTTPTSAQSNPFPRRGSVRWDRVSGAVDARGCPTTPEEHFFWEQAAIGGRSGTTASDTLAVVARRCGVQTELLSPFAGMMVAINELGFLDSTYVRNSGNFVHALLGEGGSGSAPLAYARALAYNANNDVNPDTTTVAGGPFALNRDPGVSPALDVRNDITNTATGIKAIGVNFNGLTNLIRADSVFVLDQTLRLRGLIASGGPNYGMDLNSIHDYDATTGASAGSFAHTPTANADRMAFVATPDSEIDVYDTYYPGTRLAAIPIKSPVIGPLRVAKLGSGQQILIGVTAGGVVVVRLPAVANPNTRSAGWGGGRE
jgi:hypothetical protein